jgi:hypothetical protein
LIEVFKIIFVIVVCKLNTMSITQDVEMFALRRSSRIADKERQKFLNNINSGENVEEPKRTSPKPKAKATRKKNDVVKMSVDKKAGVNTKKKTRKGKKTNKKVNKFIHLETTRIVDVFPLILKYSQTEEEKIQKYLILETIVKFRKEMNINNLMLDVFINRASIERFVYLQLSEECNEVTLITISNHLNDILSYREIDDLDMVVISTLDCDNLVNSLNMMKIESNQTAEEQMKKDLDEIEKLNSLLCRVKT